MQEKGAFFRKMMYGIVKNGEFLTLRGIKYSERAYNLGEFVVTQTLQKSVF